MRVYRGRDCTFRIESEEDSDDEHIAYITQHKRENTNRRGEQRGCGVDKREDVQSARDPGPHVGTEKCTQRARE